MTRWTKRQIAATIDHAALKPNLTDQDLVENCRLGKRYHVASVCVRPSDVALAAQELAGSGVVPSAVIGFPHGAHRPEVKALEAALAIEDGARELDMVMNIGKFLSGDEAWVRRDIEGVVAEARRAGGVLVKVILETCYLTADQIARACEIARDAGADFVKTSTGKSPVSATPEAAAAMLDVIADTDRTVGLKPSGGIRTAEQAAEYLALAAGKLGDDYLSPATFRFGASSLLDSLLA